MNRLAVAALFIVLPWPARAQTPSSERPRPRWVSAILFDVNGGFEVDLDMFKGLPIPEEADPGDLAYLIDALTDAAFANRPLSEAGIDKIAAIGMAHPETALPSLTEIASNAKNPKLRRAALSWFDRVALSNDKASAADKEAALRFVAGFLAGDPDPEMRLEAVLVLQFNRQPAGIAALENAVRTDKVFKVRMEAALALVTQNVTEGAVRDFAAELAAVARADASPAGVKRVDAIDGLCRLALPTGHFDSIEPLLLKIVEDDGDADARVEANSCLQTAGDKAAGAVAELQRVIAREPSEFVRLQLQRTVDGVLHPEQFFVGGPD